MTNSNLPSNYVCAIAKSPAFDRDHTCFAAQQSGLYRSHDKGQSWENVIATLSTEEPLAAQAVAFSPNYDGDFTLFATLHGGILRSTDGGDSWQIYPLPTPPPLVSALVTSPNYIQDGQAFCATMEDGIFCTRDRGGYWAAWNFGLLDLETLSLVISPQFAHDDTLIAGTESGIYRSKNGGRAWRALDLPFEVGPVTSLVFSLDGQTLFAGTLDGELLRSDNHGTSWVLTARFEESIDQIVLGQDFARSPEILLLSGAALFFSSNAGQTWGPRKSEITHPENITCFAVTNDDLASGPILVGTMDQGVVTIN